MIYKNLLAAIRFAGQRKSFYLCAITLLGSAIPLSFGFAASSEMVHIPSGKPREASSNPGLAKPFMTKGLHTWSN